MKRSKQQVIFDLLSAASAKNGIRKTHLMYKANLSHESLKRYLDELLSAGLLEEAQRKKKTVYLVTGQGEAYLEEARRFMKLQEAFGL